MIKIFFFLKRENMLTISVRGRKNMWRVKFWLKLRRTIFPYYFWYSSKKYFRKYQSNSQIYLRLISPSVYKYINEGNLSMWIDGSSSSSRPLDTRKPVTIDTSVQFIWTGRVLSQKELTINHRSADYDGRNMEQFELLPELILTLICQ